LGPPPCLKTTPRKWTARAGDAAGPAEMVGRGGERESKTQAGGGRENLLKLQWQPRASAIPIVQGGDKAKRGGTGLLGKKKKQRARLITNPNFEGNGGNLKSSSGNGESFTRGGRKDPGMR